MTRQPSSRKSARFSSTAGCLAMNGSRSGATKTDRAPAKLPSRPWASRAKTPTVAGAKSTASGSSEGSATMRSSKAAGPMKCRVSGARITSTRRPYPAISRAISGAARAPGPGPTRWRIKEKLGSALVLPFGGGLGRGAQELVFSILLRTLPEPDLQFALAHLLYGDAQRVLRPSVNLRARYPQRLVQSQNRGVLVDLARPLGTGHDQPVPGVNLVQKLINLKVVHYPLLLRLLFEVSLSCPCEPAPARGLRPRSQTRR